jgi:hypothetical protein
MNKSRELWPMLLLLCGCAGISRDFQSCGASNFGSDWIVLQYGYDGKPINCWKLADTAITNEQRTDGIYWQSPTGHLVHISGWYNRVQVDHGDYAGAAGQLGIELSSCAEGAYRTTTKTAKVVDERAPEIDARARP